MEIGQPFNTLDIQEYFYYIDNYKKYKDFNTLGLYRSIVENENLSLDEKILIREYAHKIFQKSFDFLQLKDPGTFIKVSTIGRELTKVEERQIWEVVRKNQEKILKDKRLGHRNFGDYAKHNCGYDSCVYNGLMIRQGSVLAESSMHFHTDKDKHEQKNKSKSRKLARKNVRDIIDRELDLD